MKAAPSLAMLLDNREPIADGDSAYTPILSDLQPNILTGHGRGNACFFLVRFPDEAGASAKARGIVHALLRHLDFPSELELREQRRPRAGTAARKAKDGSVAALLFTDSGYRKLGVTPPSDAAFQAGMAARATALGDPAPDSWDPRYRGVDALLMVAHDGPAFSQLALVEEIFQQHDAAFSVDRGYALRAAAGHPIEPFGFRDGISQPLFYASDLAYKVAQGVVPASLKSQWDASAPLGMAVCPDPHGGTPASCGSYFVLRKLRQRVDLFYQQVDEIAAATGRPDEDILAELMGRRRDGQPLTRHDGLNGYDYKDDSAGAVCPFHAHTRKMNPRSDLPGNYLPRRHRVVRRAMAYGPPIPRDATGRPTSPGTATDDVGLLFLCAQGQLGLQYEHLQSAWANSRLAGGKLVGVDPLVGHASGGEMNRIAFRTLDKDTARLFALPVRFDWRPVIETRGGDYFFAPSLSFLKNLDAASSSSSAI